MDHLITVINALAVARDALNGAPQSEVPKDDRWVVEKVESAQTTINCAIFDLKIALGTVVLREMKR